MKMRGIHIFFLLVHVCIVTEGDAIGADVSVYVSPSGVRASVSVSPIGGGSAVDSVGPKGARPDAKLLHNPQQINP